MGFEKYFAIFLFVLLTAGLVFAAPGIPHRLFGTVTINGAPANNASIVAKISGVAVATTLSDNGEYGFVPNTFDVPDPNSNNAGKKIELYLNDNKVAETTFENGKIEQVDLSYGVAPFCGDGQCNAGEDCSTCEADCGICPAPPAPPGPGGGSPGGPGGGSSGGNLKILFDGNCINSAVRVVVVNINDNPVDGAEIAVMLNRTEIMRKTTDAEGKATFRFTETGKYQFVARKGIASSILHSLDVIECAGTEDTNGNEEPENGNTLTSEELCAGIDCDDANPCTREYCYNGFCNYDHLSGDACGTDLVCDAGACVPITPEETEDTGNNANEGNGATGFFGLSAFEGNVLLGILVILGIASFAYFLTKRKKK